MPIPTYAHGRSIAPTLVANDEEYHAIALQDVRASTGDFTYANSVGGLQVSIAGMYQLSAEVRWYGGSRIVGGWHAIRIRLSGPLLDGWVANARGAQIDDVRTAVIQSGSGLQYLHAGDSLWIEGAHHSLYPMNADAALNILLAFPVDDGDMSADTEGLGPFNHP